MNIRSLILETRIVNNAMKPVASFEALARKNRARKATSINGRLIT